MRSIRRHAAPVLLGLTVVVVSAAMVPAAGIVPWSASVSRVVAPGITYTRLREPAGPWIVHVLRVDLGRADLRRHDGSRADGALREDERHGGDPGAVAAVNGDFSSSRGVPCTPSLGTDAPGSRAAELPSSASPRTSCRGTPNARLCERSGTWPPGNPSTSHVRVSGARRGRCLSRGTEDKPNDLPPAAAPAATAARRRPRWGDAGEGVMRDYLSKPPDVHPSRCGAAGTLWCWRRRDGGRGGVARDVRARSARSGLAVVGGAGVMDLIGGMPLIVKDGRNMASCSSAFCRRNPDGDGGRGGRGLAAPRRRRTHTLLGRHDPAAARTLSRRPGCSHAINLDGGGSSSMWIRREGVVNDPSDSARERPVSNAVLVLGGPDVDEPILALFARHVDLAAPGSGGLMGLARTSVDAGLFSWLAAHDLGSDGKGWPTRCSRAIWDRSRCRRPLSCGRRACSEPEPPSVPVEPRRPM